MRPYEVTELGGDVNGVRDHIKVYCVCNKLSL